MHICHVFQNSSANVDKIVYSIIIYIYIIISVYNFFVACQIKVLSNKLIIKRLNNTSLLLYGKKLYNTFLLYIILIFIKSIIHFIFNFLLSILVTVGIIQAGHYALIQASELSFFHLDKNLISSLKGCLFMALSLWNINAEVSTS